ncbi:MAG: HAD-IA family hydrolase [Rhodospirillales bacterium]|nr:HAD-IA family hydrolase [Rhodospirillales bacterium]MBT7147979.1 HAD-IA family hydrolase [Rhodospirillales bacterium]
MKDTQLIIFDCDGVLVDTEMIGCMVLSQRLGEAGIHVTTEECLDQFIGRSAESIRKLAEDLSGIGLPDTFVTDIRERTLAELSHGVAPTPGTHEILSMLTQPVCVASSGTHTKIRQSLTLSGLLPFFEPHLFSGTQVDNGKPAPDLFLYAAQQMRASPSTTIVVEDSCAGVEAAVAAGMIALGYTGGNHIRTGHAEMLHETGATAVISHMRELPYFLARI